MHLCKKKILNSFLQIQIWNFFINFQDNWMNCQKQKKCRLQYVHSRGTMQHQRSCQNSCSIQIYVVPTAAEFVQRRVCFVNVQSSLPENVVFSASARMYNAAYNIFIMWNSISCLSAWYYFRFNVSCGVAIMVRSRQIEFQVIF